MVIEKLLVVPVSHLLASLLHELAEHLLLMVHDGDDLPTLSILLCGFEATQPVFTSRSARGARENLLTWLAVLRSAPLSTYNFQPSTRANDVEVASLLVL